MPRVPEVSCPSDARLADWLDGKVSGTEWEELTEHIEQCSACQNALERVGDDSGTIAAELRLGSDGGSPADEATHIVRHHNESTGAVGAPSWFRPRQNNADDPLIGTLFGQYRIEEKIGQGGMGTVYRATHTSLSKTVALKLLPPHALSDAESVERFQREMRAIGGLNHPNIVGAHDAGSIDGIHYLVMEFIEGEDLASFIRTQGRLSPRSACKLIRQAATGLQHAHEHGLIHRDIKPSNLILTAGPGRRTVKVLDLGLARLQAGLAEPVTEMLTSTGQIMGTVDFMAPEQAVNTKNADERSDVYSLGITLFYLLAGRAPYEGETPMEKLLAHREAPLPSLSDMRRSIPSCIQQIFERMAAKDPGDRYESMQKTADALDECITVLMADREGRVHADSDDEIPDEEAEIPGTDEQTTVDQPDSAAGGTGRSNDSRETLVRPAQRRRRITVFLTGSAALAAFAAIYLIVAMAFESGNGDEGQSDSTNTSSGFSATTSARFEEKEDRLALSLKEGDSVELPTTGLDWHGPLTVEFVVTPGEACSGPLYLHQGRGKNRCGLLIRAGDRRWQFDYQSVDGDTVLRAAGGLPDTAKPSHIAGVFDGSQIFLFVDGRRFDGYRIEGQPAPGTRRSVVGGTPFRGTVEAMRISRVARYSKDVPPPDDIVGFSADPDTLANYDFSRDSGETLRDASGNGFDGRIRGAEWIDPALPRPDSRSEVVPALLLDGSNDYISVPRLPADARGPLTVEFWTTPHSRQPRNADRAITVWGGGGWNLTITNGKWKHFRVGMNPFSSDAVVVVNRRTHVAITCDEKTGALFIDGRKQSQAGVQTADPPSALIATFGAVLDGDVFANGVTPYSGTIDEYRISSAILYTTDFAPAGTLESDPDDTRVLYHFDEAAGTLLHDASGNGHDGSVKGAEWVKPGTAVSTPSD